MKIYILIFCTMVTGVALHGSTTESPLDQIRDLILSGEGPEAANKFIASNREVIINSPDDFVKTVYELLTPLVLKQSIFDASAFHSFLFLMQLIWDIPNLSGVSAETSAKINKMLVNSTFYSYTTHKKDSHLMPILFIPLLLPPKGEGAHLPPERQIEYVRDLLYYGANPNAINYSRITALMIASNRKLFVVAKLLLQHGAKPSLKDKGRRTARDYALKAGDTKLAALLYFAEHHETDKSDFKEGDI